MKVLIINLPASKLRFSFQLQQMQSLGLSYEVLPAVATSDISDEEYAKNGMGWERPLRKTELACFKSHKKAWEKVLSSNEPMLILEDDALLSKNVAHLLKVLKSQKDCDLITLEVRSRKKLVGNPKLLIGETALLPLFQDRTGAAAYILWPTGAQIMINKANRISPGLADAFISSTYHLRAYQIEPAAAIQLDQSIIYGVNVDEKTESSILSENKPDSINNFLLKRIFFIFRRLASQCRIGFRCISVFWKSERRFITLHPDDFV